MKTKYIIVNTNSDNAIVNFWQFIGTENELIQKLFDLASESAIEINCDEDEVPYTTDAVIYDYMDETYQIIVSSSVMKLDEIFTAKELNLIEEFSK